MQSFRMLNSDQQDSNSPSPPPPPIARNIPKLIVTQPSTDKEDSPVHTNDGPTKFLIPNPDVAQENNNNNNSDSDMGTNRNEQASVELVSGNDELTGSGDTTKALVKVTIPPNPDNVQSSSSSSSTSTSGLSSSDMSPTSSSISVVVVQHDKQRVISSSTSDYDMKDQRENRKFPQSENKSDTNLNQRSSQRGAPAKPVQKSDSFYNSTESAEPYTSSDGGDGASSSGPDDSRLSMSSDHFEIVWSNLCYRIQPKWYKKVTCLNRLSSVVFPVQTIDSHSSATSTASSSAGMNDNQHQMHSSSNADSHLQTAQSARQKTYDAIEIFSDLNGTIKSGQMTAVLGPSGAGKTTLLNCLTGKQRSGVSGHINLIGANGKHLKMCTIPQKDHLLELLTVEENLWFASKIKNPEYGFDHVKNIERVIDLLGLKRCRTAKIKKISGGQHKRVSIAQELLSQPDILVLDEPTSGLDSLTCFKTISMLRDLVELSANNDFMKPMAIIVTIHQPQPKVFNLFHHVYILANGGRVIYEGKPELSLATITTMTGLQPVEGMKSADMVPGAVDPASFLIEIASEEYGSEPIKILSEHQRDMFYLTNGSRGTYNHNRGSASLKIPNHTGYGQFHSNVAQEKDNHGFVAGDKSPKLKRVSSTTFPTDPSYRGNTKELSAKKQKKFMISSNLDFSKDASKKKEQDKESNNNYNNRGFASDLSNASQVERASSTTGSLYMSEQLLYTREPNHKGRFWSQTATLTHRTLLTIRRDPLLMTSRVLFHLMIPILMGYVYGKATGSANACPNYMPEIDIMTIPSLVEGKRVEYMLEELHMSIENVSMFFITMYAFSAAVLALNALSFPLNMQVLLKETRNSWYSLPSFVVAKTLADLPLELTMPCLTMAMVYPLTGQPDSYMHWRMLTICLIMTLCSLIAQTQALILGALVMGSVQTAVFVSQASQLPWVILAGFTIRIKRLSEPLKFISLTSFYRLGCEAITLARYGFGICPCDPKEITGEPVKLVGIPDQLRTLAQYWFENAEPSASVNDTVTESVVEDYTASTMATAMTTTTMATTVQSSKTDLFQHIANQLSFANSYGVNITSCRDVTPDRIRAIDLDDSWLVARIWHLLLMLVILKIVLYYSVKFSIGIRL